MTKKTTSLFETELAVFERHREEWLESDLGRFALLKGETVLGPYDTQNDAISIGYKEYGNVPFLVKEVAAFDRPITLLNIAA